MTQLVHHIGGIFYLTRHRLNAGGYDANGFYFGIGLPLYRWELSDRGQPWPRQEVGISGYVRARDRDHAKAIIRQSYAAMFFR